uniref:Uncharacterized protein n=1 Tax=Meloidogyne javanica TaxID=6303 RepID=A0A915MEY7_MELJA
MNNNKNTFYNSTNTFYEQEYSTKTKKSASEQLSENFGRIVDNLPNKIHSDIRLHLQKVYSTAALCLLCSIFGIFFRGIFNFNAFLHKFVTFLIFCLFIGLGICSYKQNLEIKRFYGLLMLSWLIGIKFWSFFEFFGFEYPGHIEFNFFFGALIVYASFALSVIHSESIQCLHLCATFLSTLFSFLLTFFVAPNFIYPTILWSVLTTNALFVIYDTQMITEKRQQKDTDYIWHTACRYLRGKPQIMTYDMSRLPSDIAVRLTLAQDEIIRRFVRAIFYTYLPLTVGGTELITKRRGNVVYVAGFLIPKGNMEQIYWLYGFTEEILSNLLKQPVKLELQFIRSADDLAVEYFVQPTTTP